MGESGVHHREAVTSFLRDEIVQKSEEGYEVEDISEELQRLANDASDEELETLCRRLDSLSRRIDFPYEEPSDLQSIRRHRLSGPRRVELSLSDRQLHDKIYGAWLGRCVGCMLGKPVELWTKDKIKKYLELAHAYPLINYVPLITPLHVGYEMKEDAYEKALYGRITCAARDDDLDYTVMNLQILRRKGLGFTTHDVGETWLTLLPYMMTYTAEKAAYRNLVDGIWPPESAIYRNPYREWIGAQIRADAWAYVTPGHPELSATLAHRDASLSHVKNGIYGEMFVAAMISAAFASDNTEEIVRAGLSEIPSRSRLAEVIGATLAWARECRTWEEAWSKIMSKYGSYSPMHSLLNAAIVLLGLLFGENDFEKSITISVMAGSDTDCNGATCGSIVGAILGRKKLPSKWIDPLNDRLMSAILGHSDCQISEMAKHTFVIAKKSLEYDLSAE